MKVFIIMLALIGIISCTDSRTKQISSFLKDKKEELIIIPDSFCVKDLNIDSTYSFSASNDFVNSPNLRIVTSINGDCHACVNQLKEWKTIINKFSKERVGFLFFIYAENYSRFELMNLEEINFKYPVVYDYKNDFVIKNKIPDDYLLNTMLIDNIGKIIIIGNPLKSKKILGLYNSVIIEYYENSRKK